MAGQLQNKCSKFQIKVLHFILPRIPVDGVKKLPNMRFFVRHEVLALCFDSEVYIDSSELQQWFVLCSHLFTSSDEDDIWHSVRIVDIRNVSALPSVGFC